MAHSPLEEILSQAVNVQMPQLDQEMEDGAVVQWLKAAGDPVAQGEVIVEIETDKAIVRWTRRRAGYCGALTYQPAKSSPWARRWPSSK